MGVLAVQLSQSGLVPNTTGLGNKLSQQLPTIAYIETNNTLAQVLVTGFLNESRSTYGYAYNNQQVALVYTTDQGAVWLQISVSGTNYSLVGTSSAATVYQASLGSVTAPSYTFSGRTDVGFYSSAAHELDVALNGGLIASFLTSGLEIFGNVISGTSTVAGGFAAYPGGNGALILDPIVNTVGNFVAFISNSSTLAQTTTYTLADPTNANGRILVGATATPFTNNHLVVASGTGGAVADAGFQMKSVAKAVVAGGAAAQTVTDAFCTTTSTVLANWSDTTNAVEIETVAAGNGSFIVTSTGDPGASHLNYIITKTS